MHKFEQDFFAAQDLRPTLYVRHVDDINFLWTHAEESQKRLHNDINKFHPTIKLTMDYSLESVSFLDMHFHQVWAPQQALRMHRICSDEEGSDQHLKMLKDAIIRTGWDAQLTRQLKNAVKNGNNLLRRWTQDTTNRVSFVVQYFPGVRNYAMFVAAFNISSMMTNISPRKLPSLQNNSDHVTTQFCHGNICKTCQIIDMDTTITYGNATFHIHSRCSCDVAKVAYL
eukprot:g39036.t1